MSAVTPSMTLLFALLVLVSAAWQNCDADSCANDVLLLQKQAQVSERSVKSLHEDSVPSLDEWPQPSSSTVSMDASTVHDKLGKALEMPLLDLSGITLARLENMEELPGGKSGPPAFTKPDEISCASYHKTGTELCSALNAHSAYWNASFVRSFSGGMDLPRKGGDANHRLLHFVRDPVEVIISGFRYHLTHPPEEMHWGWLSERCMPLWPCSELDHDTLFGSCLERCSYFNALDAVSSTNETLGVIMEAVLERDNINTMWRNTSALGHDPFVLHLTPEHLRTDFNQTMQCINVFLAGQGIEAERLAELQELNQANPNYFTLDSHAYDRATHDTVGQYDNDGIRQFLSSSAWGSQFAYIRQFYTMLFQRQADMYGCPMV